MDKQIIYYYRRGVASYLIAQRFKVSNSYVRGLLKKRGIKLRGHSTTNKMSADRRTPEENRAITQKASEANLGSVHTATHRSKLAISRQQKPVIDQVYEQPLVDLCNKLGVKNVPQKAFSKYNIDLYLVKENVVIEIFGGGFHNKKDAVDLFNNKVNYLSRIKVPVLIVWSDKLTYKPERVLAIAQKCTDKITIINGDGTPTKRGLSDIILND
jgi:very-short-patch-repair endonuclease